jgi:hypothetical protein
MSDVEPTFPRYEKKQLYRQVFWEPGGEQWYVEADWRESYFSASRALLEGIVSGKLTEPIEGVVGVFLFRHYLELAIKYVLFHARWLKNERENASDIEVEAVKPKHHLLLFWDRAKEACVQKVHAKEWASWDVNFIDACVKEFETFDPDPGVIFRYPNPGFKVGQLGQLRHPLGIDHAALLQNMDHVHEVLEEIDSYLIANYHGNQDSEDILNLY